MRVAVTARKASREGIRAHVAPAVSPRTTGNHLFVEGLRSRVTLARLPFTPLHRQARLLWCRKSVDWKLEWRSVVFSDENEFSLYASDGHTCVQLDLVSVIFRTAFPHDTQVPPQASWCGGHQLQLPITFSVSAG